MGGFVRNFAPYAAVLQGQQQGEAANQAYQKQIQDRQLEDLLRRQLLLGQLRDARSQRDALGALPKDEQQYLNLPGASIGDWQKRQDVKVQATAMRDQIYQSALDPNLPLEEKLRRMQMVVNLDQHPELMSLPEYQKFGSATEKTPTRPFHPFTADSTVQAFEGYDASGKPILQSLGAAKPAAETPSQKMQDTPLGLLKGINVVSPDGTPWPNTVDTYAQAIAKGGVPISDANQKILAMNMSADAELQNLLSAGQAVLPGGSASGLSKAAAPLKIGTEAFFGEPGAASFRAAQIGLITHLRAVANASRINQAELAQVNGALQNAHSYPALQAAVAQARNLLQKGRANLVKAGSINGRSASAPSDMPPVPMGMRQKFNGKWYENVDGTVREVTNP